MSERSDPADREAAEARNRVREVAEQEAAEARKKALACTDPRMKEEWAKVARKWEELANESRAV